MEKVQEIMSKFLLVFQICLATWQFLKLTPVGGLLQGGFQWMISLLPCCQSSDYALLRHCEGRVFKKVRCFVLTKAPGSHDDLIQVVSQPSGESCETILNIQYLRKDFRLERRDGNKLFVNDEMSYYITHAMWQTLLLMPHSGPAAQTSAQVQEEYVYLKGYKGFWESVVTGGVMKFSEALDCIILERQYPIMDSDVDWLLPVNLSLSEEKVVKILNLVGFFLQTKKKVFWLIPLLLTLASAVLEFSTELRAWVYSNINRLFCRSVHLLCDKLPYSMRRQVYSLGKWVENLKPSNDIHLRVVKGDICAPIAGGAKADREDATVVHWLSVEEQVTKMAFHCDPIDIVCSRGDNQCGVSLRYSNNRGEFMKIDFKDWEEFMKMCTFCACVARNCSGSLKSYNDGRKKKVKSLRYSKMCTFLDCVARNRSGSLKSYDDGKKKVKKKVKVRGWKESVRLYAQSGYPPIYELRLQNVIVSSI